MEKCYVKNTSKGLYCHNKLKTLKASFLTKKDNMLNVVTFLLTRIYEKKKLSTRSDIIDASNLFAATANSKEVEMWHAIP